MKYYSMLPATALFALSLISVLVHYAILPPGISILENLKAGFGDYFFVLIFCIILLESVIYIGFYFPGQFFAVVLVVLSNPTSEDILWLTVAMVFAATTGSLINFYLGKLTAKQHDKNKKVRVGSLLLAMIHINSLAFYMFNQGANSRSVSVIWLAGLLNLPYYLALITATALLSEEIMQVAESTWLMLILVSIWLVIAILLDIKQYRQNNE
ncbi:hypothetical protein [Aliiglaciecola lipolytica]|uniref:Membrane-associated protein n=1 Tax=Aliiglaciecola lipolytica E3 TaxID=1127673 RepID=K6X0W3_9ALTE|nr:hypothetical protein [Aliiglaciecola lipolytica]GAC14284.1 membrane-associated protein [Aliiglaciecola lipolytica E3]